MKTFLFVLLALGSWFPAFCSPPILRAVLVCDTNKWIGNSVQADVWRISNRQPTKPGDCQVAYCCRVFKKVVNSVGNMI